MKGKIHSESEMVKSFKELESGVKAEEVCRNHGIAKQTLYNGRPKYSGMEVSQIKRLKELEEENRKLKQMYADLALDNQILRDVIEKKLRARGKERACGRNFCRIRVQHLSGVQADGNPPILLLLSRKARRHRI